LASGGSENTGATRESCRWFYIGRMTRKTFGWVLAGPAGGSMLPTCRRWLPGPTQVTATRRLGGGIEEDRGPRPRKIARKTRRRNSRAAFVVEGLAQRLVGKYQDQHPSPVARRESAGALLAGQRRVCSGPCAPTARIGGLHTAKQFSQLPATRFSISPRGAACPAPAAGRGRYSS